jgi:mono/diheme cytochrome c family protein
MRTILLVLFVLVVLAAIFLFSGTYNIAAVEPHSAAVRWLFATARDRSVERHSEDIQSPPLSDAALSRAGFHEYHEMCVVCHGAPGREPSAIGKGLNPEPPKLDAEGVQARSDAELYWIVKNGLRMTGMPAFGPTHEEKTLWAIVAFLRRLPETTPQQYGAMVEAAGLQGGAGGHAHSHAPAQGHGPTEEAKEGAHRHHGHEH